MTRNEAYTLLITYLHNPNLIKHCLCCEVAMQALCTKLHPEADESMRMTWGITGLLHDVDYEIAQKENKLEQHGLLIFEKETTIPKEIAHAIQAHNFEYTKVEPKTDMDWAIACVDQLTGLIIACTLIHPDKKLASIDPSFVLRRFGKKDFAKGARREAISRCEEKLGIPLEEFVSLTLASMQKIHTELGL